MRLINETELSHVFGGAPPPQVATSTFMGFDVGMGIAGWSVAFLVSIPTTYLLFKLLKPAPSCSFGYSPGYDDDGKFIGCFK